MRPGSSILADRARFIAAVGRTPIRDFTMLIAGLFSADGATVETLRTDPLSIAGATPWKRRRT